MAACEPPTLRSRSDRLGSALDFAVKFGTAIVTYTQCCNRREARQANSYYRFAIKVVTNDELYRASPPR